MYLDKGSSAELKKNLKREKKYERSGDRLR
jgi:hypothetical protein